MSEQGKDEVGCAVFVFGVVLGCLAASIVWAVADQYWAKDRDAMMAECIKTYTYESCIATYRVEPQAPKLDLLKKPATP